MSALSDRILARAGRAGLRRVKPKIPSKTLRRACHYTPTIGDAGFSRGKLHIPHYWAVILHNGRKEIRTTGRKLLIWYKNPAEDPRWAGRATPARYADRDRFQRAGTIPWSKFRKDFKAGKVIVSQKSARVDGNPFFGNEPGEGMHGFKRDVYLIALEEIAKEIREFTKEEGKRSSRMHTATARL